MRYREIDINPEEALGIQHFTGLLKVVESIGERLKLPREEEAPLFLRNFRSVESAKVLEDLVWVIHTWVFRPDEKTLLDTLIDSLATNYVQFTTALIGSRMSIYKVCLNDLAF